MATTDITYVNASDFNASDLVIPAPIIKKDAAGKDKFRAYINNSAGRNVAYLGPQIYTPFGVTDFKDNGKFALQACVASANDQDPAAVEEVKRWEAELIKVDEAMKGWARANWDKIPCFKKSPSDDILEEKYSSIVRISDDPKYPTNKIKFSFGMTTWNAKLKDDEGNLIPEDQFVPSPLFEVYDDQGSQIKVKSLAELPEVIPKGTRFRTCFTMSIWCVASTGFGVKLNISTIEITRRTGIVRPIGNPFQERSKTAATTTSAPVVPYVSNFAKPTTTAAAPEPVKETKAPDSDDDVQEDDDDEDDDE